MQKEIIIEANNIQKIYKNPFGKNKTEVSNDLSIRLYKGESLGLIGNSGTGKSTLAKILLNLISFDRGEIRFKGKDISKFDKIEKKIFRQKIQYITQRPEESFDPRIKIGKSIREAVFLLKKSDTYEAELLHYMKKFDLSDILLDRYPHQISGGEVQRFAICRALLVEPEIIIFDEATSMLDVSTQANIIDIIKKLQVEKNLSYIFISHDRALIDKICDRIYEIKK